MKNKNKYHIYSKYLDTWTPYHTGPKIWTSPSKKLLICLKNCWLIGKQYRPWSDAAFCSIWSGSTLFAKAYLYKYLG